MSVGRNDPCRCGSGKKFKKCCGLHSPSLPTQLSSSTKAKIANFAREAIQHFKNGQVAQAEAACRRILLIEPENAEAYHFLGLIAAQMSHYEDAIQFISKAILLKPTEPGFHYNLAKAFKSTHDWHHAIASYRYALKLKPDFMEAKLNLGNTLKEAGKFEESAACFKSALLKAPEDGEIHYNLGNVLAAQDKLEEAAASFRQALFYKPGFAEAMTNLGNIVKDQGNLQESISCYRQAIAYKPEYFPAHHNLLYALNFDQIETPEVVADEHKNFGLKFTTRLKPDFELPMRDAARRIRIGYVSPDFRTHSCAYFFEPLLAAHDRARFEIFCYSDVKHPDVTTARLNSLAEHWRSTFGMKDDALLELIRHDQIDVLVDLAGHTDSNRLPVFAARAAPIQISWLGYPNTTGLATMDYRLTDYQTDPDGESDLFYTERLVRLPVSFLCYRPPSNSPPVTTPPHKENGHITFGCFNNATKVTPSVISTWSALLLAIPDSRLLLKSKQFKDQATRDHYVGMFGSRSVGAHRVELIGQFPDQTDHLAAYAKVDIALDPFPYNGTTTTCEALWMGVPVVCLAGQVHAGRVGVSLMHSVGQNDLVARTSTEYVAKAVALANDPLRLTELRKGLRATFLSSPLCDGKRFARDVESALLGLMN
jgi:predicted O-linked N-acetylglucosamine transferase (SPINDLY family)